MSDEYPIPTRIRELVRRLAQAERMISDAETAHKALVNGELGDHPCLRYSYGGAHGTGDMFASAAMGLNSALQALHEEYVAWDGRADD